MLARLQRAITCCMVLVAVAWALIALSRGAVGAAVAGAVLIVGAYAVVLAGEVFVMALVNNRCNEPPATAWQLAGAWIAEVLSAPRVFCWRQPFRSQVWPDHLPRSAQGGRGLLLVHGFVCNRGLWNPQLKRLTGTDTPFVAVNLEPPFGTLDDYVDSLERAVSQLERCTGRPPVVVAHSMGGLAVRRWRAEPGNAHRLHRVLTIGTPHHGTWLARFAFTRNGREMKRGSRWIQALQEREREGTDSARYGDFTCFWGHCDNIVFPASTATLAGADNRHLNSTPHVAMAEHEEVWAEVERWLR